VVGADVAAADGGIGHVVVLRHQRNLGRNLIAQKILQVGSIIGADGDSLDAGDQKIVDDVLLRHRGGFGGSAESPLPGHFLCLLLAAALGIRPKAVRVVGDKRHPRLAARAAATDGHYQNEEEGEPTSEIVSHGKDPERIVDGDSVKIQALMSVVTKKNSL